MSRSTGNRPAASRKGVNPLWTGIFVGLVIGVGMAAGLTWYLMKSPSPFLKKDQIAVNPPTDAAKPVVPAETVTPAPKSPVAGESNGKPRFEFYKVLTDKQDATVAAPAKHADKSKPADTKPAVAYEPHLLQAGSFPKADDAEKLKAKLALLGVEASVQSAAIPDKGVWYRVRLGPYKNEGELNSARSFLKQNGVDSTPIKAQ
ncbi:MAG: SPOR domain-containing protein [Nitrosomonadales bacterium]|nr:SPOR domain-containing protein [Nitrosomonadales bacterium]